MKYIEVKCGVFRVYLAFSLKETSGGINVFKLVVFLFLSWLNLRLVAWDMAGGGYKSMEMFFQECQEEDVIFYLKSFPIA